MSTIKPINQVNNNRKQRILTVTNTGYLAAGSLIFTTLTPPVKSLKKTHKFLGYLTGILVLTHLIECNKYRFKKNKLQLNINA